PAAGVRVVVPANQQLASLTQRIGEAEERHAAATARLNERLALLRDHERRAVELAREVTHADGQLARLQDAIATAEADLVERRSALAAAEVELADAERTLSQRSTAIARATEQLEQAETQLA